MRGDFLHISGVGIFELDLMIEAVHIPLSKHVFILKAYHDLYDLRSPESNGDNGLWPQRDGARPGAES